MKEQIIFILLVIILTIALYFFLEKIAEYKEIEYRINRKIVVFLATLIVPVIGSIIFYEVESVEINGAVGFYGMVGITLYAMLVNLIFIKRERISPTIEQINSSSKGSLYHFINNPIVLFEVCFKSIKKHWIKQENFDFKQERAYFSKTTRFIFIVFNISIIWINFIMLFVLMNFDSFVSEVKVDNLIYTLKKMDLEMIFSMIMLFMFTHVFIELLRVLFLWLVKLIKIPQIFQYLLFWLIIFGSIDSFICINLL